MRDGLLERLVSHNLQSHGDHELRELNQGIQKLRLLGLDPWLLSCMHQVRTFGNWMGHRRIREAIERSDSTMSLPCCVPYDAPFRSTHG